MNEEFSSFIRRQKIKINALQNIHKLNLLLSFVWDESENGETWKEIAGYDGDYFISSHGRVLSLKLNGYKLKEPQNTASGYLMVDLSQNGQRTHYKIHRLVAEAFLLKEVDQTEVHHKDGNRQNNRSNNLQWVSSEQHKEVHRIHKN